MTETNNTERRSGIPAAHSQSSKSPYVAPVLEVFDYVVERGFANTPVKTTAKTETYSEYNELGSGGYENQTGTWDDTQW